MPDTFTTITTRAALLGLRGPYLPPDTLALPLAERLRAAILRIAGPAASWQISGKDAQGRPRRDHAHLYLLPTSSRDDGRLDRTLVWADRGLLESTREILQQLGQGSVVRFGQRPPLPIERLEFRGIPSLVGPAHTWISATPFVPPRFTKRRHGVIVDAPEDQLARLCQLVLGRAPREIQPVRTRDWSRFVQRRMHDDAPPRACSGWRLDFDERIGGPIALGLGAHFGLGRFAAEIDA